MTEIQQVELEILKEFINICKKLDLTYYMVCGSALGAVKYNGFIPWDDDVDVALPRPDYEVFCERAQSLLPNYMFVQNYKTDKAFPRIYTKLRDSRTTYIEKSVKNLNMNHGVFIDVFPLDGYPKGSKDIFKLEKSKKRLKLYIECVFNVDYGLLRNAFFKVERLLGFHKKTEIFIKRLENILCKWYIYDSKIWCNHGNWQGKLEYAPKWHYGKGTWVKFEGLNVRIPENYDAYLTQKYGNWRADLPEEKKVGHHYYEVCDTSKSYLEYL